MSGSEDSGSPADEGGYDGGALDAADDAGDAPDGFVSAPHPAWPQAPTTGNIPNATGSYWQAVSNALSASLNLSLHAGLPVITPEGISAPGFNDPTL